MSKRIFALSLSHLFSVKNKCENNSRCFRKQRSLLLCVALLHSLSIDYSLSIHLLRLPSDRVIVKFVE
jgi:hypothetical protein